jgi:aspartate--ammonia ligase
MYPLLNSEQREKAFAKQYKAIFIMKIGHKLSDGTEYGLSSPNYDN